jgi:hypothetical protein
MSGTDISPGAPPTDAVFVVVVVLVVVMGVIAVALGAALGVFDRDRAAACAAEAGSTAEGVLAGAAGGPAAAATEAMLAKFVEAIPLVWAGSTYNVTVVVGVSPVTAVFDTGSELFVVATANCDTCTGATYDPSKSKTAFVLMDPRLAAAANVVNIRPGDLSKYKPLLCTTQTAYVSQTDSIQMYKDTVHFPRRLVTTASLCGGGSDAAPVAPPTDPLVIVNFPVGGIYANTGSTSLNVMGMSAVLSVTTTVVDGETVFLMPSCQTIVKASHESAIIAALDIYYSPRPVVWSQYLFPSFAQGGYLVFSRMVIPCVQPVRYIGMVPQLTKATSGVSVTPMRYYVVAVKSMVIVSGVDGSRSALGDAPAQMLLDTGTTQMLLPGQAGVQAIGDMQAGDTLVITLMDPNDASKTVSLTYTPAGLVLPSGFPAVAALSAGTATLFSSASDVGILGCALQRGLYIEYNITARMFGFGVPQTPLQGI